MCLRIRKGRMTEGSRRWVGWICVLYGGTAVLVSPSESQTRKSPCTKVQSLNFRSTRKSLCENKDKQGKETLSSCHYNRKARLLSLLRTKSSTENVTSHNSTLLSLVYNRQDI